MGDQIIRIPIPGRRPGEVVECTVEELKAYRDCVTPKFKTALFLNFVASTIIAVSTPLKSVVNVGMKRAGIWVGSFLTGQVLSQMYCASSCSHEIEKLIRSKIQNSAEHVKVASEPPSQTIEPDSFDFTPLALSDPDMSPPSSFSLDPGFKFYGTTEEEKAVPKAAEAKRVTYEELRAISRDQFSQRPSDDTSNSQFNIPERKDGDDSSSSTWPRRTNIYGDVLE